MMQQAGHPGASTFCGGGGWLTVAEAAVDREVAHLVVDPTLEHALVSTTACSLWCAQLITPSQSDTPPPSPPSGLFFKVCDLPAGVSVIGIAVCAPELKFN